MNRPATAMLGHTSEASNSTTAAHPEGSRTAMIDKHTPETHEDAGQLGRDNDRGQDSARARRRASSSTAQTNEACAAAAPSPAASVDPIYTEASPSDARSTVMAPNDESAGMRVERGAAAVAAAVAAAEAGSARPSDPGPEVPQTASDKAWEETLAKPANQSALARLAESLRGFAAGGVFGEPELIATAGWREESPGPEVGLADQSNPVDAVDAGSKPPPGHTRQH